MVALPLTGHFLDSSQHLLGVSRLSPLEIESRLSTLITRVREAHTMVELDPGDFVAALARSVADGTEIADVLARVHAADLYLATACACQVPGAIDRLEALYIAPVPRAIACVDESPIFIDNVLGRLRHRLFHGGLDRRPQIADYAGREPLGAWIRAGAMRIALNLRASIEPYIEPPSDRAPVALIDGDHELEDLRAYRAAELEAAINAAFGELGSRERAALRIHFIDGLGVEQVGRIFKVHRATVARWIDQTRQRIRELAGSHRGAR